jgi:hypothetical protein
MLSESVSPTRLSRLSVWQVHLPHHSAFASSRDRGLTEGSPDENATQGGYSGAAVLADVAAVMRRLVGILLDESGGFAQIQAKLFEGKLGFTQARGKLLARIADPDKDGGLGWPVIMRYLGSGCVEVVEVGVGAIIIRLGTAGNETDLGRGGHGAILDLAPMGANAKFAFVPAHTIGAPTRRREWIGIGGPTHIGSRNSCCSCRIARPRLPSPSGCGSDLNIAASATRKAERRCGSNGSAAFITVESCSSVRLIGCGLAGMGSSRCGGRSFGPVARAVKPVGG